MAKKNITEIDRVKHLPNVTFAEFGKSEDPGRYPWYKTHYKGMDKTLELGCGKGEHTLAFAADNPDKLYMGIDSKSHRICVGAEDAIAQKLENVQFLRARIENIESFFFERSISQIWLTFPDPHLKTRAIKSRLTAPRFLKAYANLLVPGGRVILKTDSLPLFEYTKDSVGQWGGHLVSESDDIHAGDENIGYACSVVSAFEKAAREQGSTIKFLSFELN